MDIVGLGKPLGMLIRRTKTSGPQMEPVDADCGRSRCWLSQGLCVPMCIESPREGDEKACTMHLDPHRFHCCHSFDAVDPFLDSVQTIEGYLDATNTWSMLLFTCHIPCRVH